MFVPCQGVVLECMRVNISGALFLSLFLQPPNLMMEAFHLVPVALDDQREPARPNTPTFVPMCACHTRAVRVPCACRGRYVGVMCACCARMPGGVVRIHRNLHSIFKSDLATSRRCLCVYVCVRVFLGFQCSNRFYGSFLCRVPNLTIIAALTGTNTTTSVSTSSSYSSSSSLSS